MQLSSSGEIRSRSGGMFKLGRLLLLVALILSSFVAFQMVGKVASIKTHASTGTFRNPLSPTADPFMSFYNGQYYLIENSSDNTLRVRHAASIGSLLLTDPTIIYTETDPTWNHDIWAPSFYTFNDRWYVYWTGDDGTVANHRMRVLESDALLSQGATPASSYHFKSTLNDPANNIMGIDGIPFVHNNQLYFVWAAAYCCGFDTLRLSTMSNPYTLSGTSVALNSDICEAVAEAPAILHRNGRTWLVYSVCDTGKPDYQLKMQSINDGSDPMVPNNWHDYGTVFASNNAAGTYSVGSNGFFTSPDGREDWIVYQGKNTNLSGNDTYFGRDTRAQKFTWNADGSPNFGAPVGVGDSLPLPSGDPGTGSVAINDTDTTPNGGVGYIQYSSGWTAGTACGNQCYLGNDTYTNITGSTATIHFNGTRLALLSVKDVGNGIAGVSIDGGPETMVDYYGPVRDGQRLQYLSPVLSAGSHTLQIRVTGNHNPASNSTYIGIDRVEIMPSAGNPPPTATSTPRPLSTATATPTPVIAGSLKGFWTMNEGSGSVVGDTSGNGNNGVNWGATSWTAGKSGSALNFTPHANVDIFHNAIVDTSASYTVGAWVKLSGTSGWQSIVGGPEGAQVSGFILLYSQSLGNHFSLTVPTSDCSCSGSARANGTTVPQVGVWYHVMGVYDGGAGQLRLYVNGNLEATTNVSKGWHAGGAMRIARDLWGGPTDYYNGTIDQVRLYNRSLSGTEVMNIFNSGQ